MWIRTTVSREKQKCKRIHRRQLSIWRLTPYVLNTKRTKKVSGKRIRGGKIGIRWIWQPNKKQHRRKLFAVRIRIRNLWLTQCSAQVIVDINKYCLFIYLSEMPVVAIEPQRFSEIHMAFQMNKHSWSIFMCIQLTEKDNTVAGASGTAIPGIRATATITINNNIIWQSTPANNGMVIVLGLNNKPLRRDINKRKTRALHTIEMIEQNGKRHKMESNIHEKAQELVRSLLTCMLAHHVIRKVWIKMGRERGKKA